MPFNLEEKQKEKTFGIRKCNQFPNIIYMQYFGKASTKRKNKGVLLSFFLNNSINKHLLCNFPSLQDYSRIKFSTSLVASLPCFEIYALQQWSLGQVMNYFNYMVIIEHFFMENQK